MTGKVALVTGAGSGIGEAISRRLARDGYDLVLMTRSDGAEKLAAEIGGIGLRGSVTEEEDLRRMVDTAITRHGHIDVVINNPGHAPNTGIAGTGGRYDPDADLRLHALTDADWGLAFDLIFMSVVRMSRLVAPGMVAQGGGAILNITSFAQREPSYAYPTGSCMRMAVEGYAKLFADSYGRMNLRMNNLLPGFLENFPFDPGVRAQVPLGRAGLMDEIADTAAFLVSAGAGYITGQSILVDGGLNRGT